jgi:hypothetical protein
MRDGLERDGAALRALAPFLRGAGSACRRTTRGMRLPGRTWAAGAAGYVRRSGVGCACAPAVVVYGPRPRPAAAAALGQELGLAFNQPTSCSPGSARRLALAPRMVVDPGDEVVFAPPWFFYESTIWRRWHAGPGSGRLDNVRPGRGRDRGRARPEHAWSCQPPNNPMLTILRHARALADTLRCHGGSGERPAYWPGRVRQQGAVRRTQNGDAGVLHDARRWCIPQQER